MKILFTHQNFPAQFKHLAPALAQRGHDVKALAINNHPSSINLIRYPVRRKNTTGLHPWMVDMESKFIRAEAVFYAALKLRDDGFNPDVISSLPKAIQQITSVIHDGIDTEQLKPSDAVELKLNDNIKLTKDSEIITFVNRNLEPMRGYHVFMRSLPAMLRKRPNARVIIVGGDDVSYGAKPPAGSSWKHIFLHEVRDQLDMSRVHFVGKLAYTNFIKLLQISSVHVYLTYPFVLSWSLLEAMSLGCAIVASNTAPVREVITHKENGLLVDFFDREGLCEAVCDLLESQDERKRLGAAARETVISRYDLHSQCLPQQLAWVEALAATTST